MGEARGGSAVDLQGGSTYVALGAHGLSGALELLALGRVLAELLAAAQVIEVVDPALLGAVHVREAGIISHLLLVGAVGGDEPLVVVGLVSEAALQLLERLPVACDGGHGGELKQLSRCTARNFTASR